MLKLLLAATTVYQTRDCEALRAASTFGRLDLAEVCCSADSRLTECVRKLGGKAQRFSEWNGYNLITRRGALRLLEDLRRWRPRHVFFSPPCGPESPMQNANQRTPTRVAELSRKRHRVHRIQRHIRMIIKAMREEFPDMQTHVEQPGACGSWRNEFRELKLQIGRWTAVDRVFRQTLERTCSKDHVHQPLEGAAVTLSAPYPWKMVEKLAK